MYKSPIELFESPVHDVIKQMYEEKENYIYQCVADIGVNVDKEELIRALQYDRGQYDKGYRDGCNTNRWINVKDRLPEKDEDVLIYRGQFRGHLINVYTYLGNNEWEDEYGYWSRTDDEGITHWMPLPEPPTVKED